MQGDYLMGVLAVYMPLSGLHAYVVNALIAVVDLELLAESVTEHPVVRVSLPFQLKAPPHES